MKFEDRLFTRKVFLSSGSASLLSLIYGCEASRPTAQAIPEKPANSSATPPKAQLENESASLVRFVHADPTNTVGWFFCDEVKLTEDIPYKSVTGYLPVPAGRKSIKLKAPEDARELASIRVNFTKGGRYTVLQSLNNNGQAALKLLEDNVKKPEQNKAKVRWLEASPWLEGLSVSAVAPSTFRSFDLSSSDQFQDIDPYSGNLEVKARRSGKLLANLEGVQLEAGKLHTVVVVGGKNQQPVEKLLIVDKVL